jgi:MoxR-like ATPase
MDESITDQAFDSLKKNRDEFRLLFRSYSDAMRELKAQPSRTNAVSMARLLNSMYLDVLLANKSMQSCLAEQVEAFVSASDKTSKTEKRPRKKNGSRPKAVVGDPGRAFVIYSMRSCTQQLTVNFSASGSHNRLDCGILCCGVLSGLGLIVSSVLQLSPVEGNLVEEEIASLHQIMEELNLDEQFTVICGDLDGWIEGYWKKQETASSFDQNNGDGRDGPFAIFWVTQVLQLYNSVSYLLNIAIESSLIPADLELGVADKLKGRFIDSRAGVASVAEAHIAAWIVRIHSGLLQNLSRSTLYWLAIYLMNSSKLECEHVSAYMLEIIFAKFFIGGCFSLAGVEATANANSSASSEALAVLLYCDLFRRISFSREWGDRAKTNPNREKDAKISISLGNLAGSVFSEHFKEIASHLLLLKAAHERKSWYRNAGMQTADDHLWCTCLISSGILLSDELLDRSARKALGVQQFVQKPEGNYPIGWDFMQKQVIGPILRGGSARDDASYSMILYGPPGTAKTTLAKKIAFDLNWPFLEIGQRDFLREGSDMIDAQADRIFRYCGYLRDVVILFDELEELILDRETSHSDRESRLLTTSMLPRIQELRERKSVVFIFATNRLKTLDLAATRLGRFDIIKYVGYPDHDTKIKMLTGNKAHKGNPVLKLALESFARNTEFDALTANMAFGDLNYLLRRIRQLDAAKRPPENTASDEITRLAGGLASDIVLRFRELRTSDKTTKIVKDYDDLSRQDRPQ